MVRGAAYIASAGGGVWRRNSAGWLRLDWSSGEPLDTPEWLYGLNNGHLLAVQRTSGSVELDLTRRLPQSVRSARRERFVCPIVQDIKGSSWACEYSPTHDLMEWGGSGWIRHPGGHFSSRIANLTCDSLGDVWLLQAIDLPVNVYDPAIDVWSFYPTYRDALVARRNIAGMRLSPKFDYVADFSGDGQIVYRDGPHSLDYYDGSTWRT